MFRLRSIQSNTEIVRNCQSYFSFNLPSELWSRRVKRFDVKYATCGGSFVNYGNNVTIFNAVCHAFLIDSLLY